MGALQYRQIQKLRFRRDVSTVALIYSKCTDMVVIFYPLASIRLIKQFFVVSDSGSLCPVHTLDYNQWSDEVV